MSIKRLLSVVLAVILSAGVCAPGHAATVATASGKRVDASAVDTFLKARMKTLGIPGLSIAIINNGEIVYHRELGVADVTTGQPVDANSIFEAASLSKPLFAYFAMRMVEKGVIDLDRPLYFYLPDPEMETDQRYRSVTARMVLDHTTGFPNWRWFDPADPALKIKPGEFYMKFDPGKKFYYSGEAYNYLSRVIAHNAHLDMKALDELFQREVARPLGMAHAVFTWDDYLYDHKVTGHKNGKPDYAVWPAGNPSDNSMTFNAAGGLHINAIDYARFLIAVMDDKGLRKRSMDEMLKQQVVVPQDSSAFISDGETGWTLGFAIKPTPYGQAFEHGGNNGGFQSGFLFYKDKNWVTSSSRTVIRERCLIRI